MANKFVYTVTATFEDSGIADEWLAWLRGGHVAEVVRVSGALGAEIVRLDAPPNGYEVRYLLPSRAAFEAYERDHAPRLRAKGLKRFSAETGVRYHRTTGEVIG